MDAHIECFYFSVTYSLNNYSRAKKKRPAGAGRFRFTARKLNYIPRLSLLEFQQYQSEYPGSQIQQFDRLG